MIRFWQCLQILWSLLGKRRARTCTSWLCQRRISISWRKRSSNFRRVPENFIRRIKIPAIRNFSPWSMRKSESTRRKQQISQVTRSRKSTRSKNGACMKWADSYFAFGKCTRRKMKCNPHHQSASILTWRKQKKPQSRRSAPVHQRAALAASITAATTSPAFHSIKASRIYLTALTWLKTRKAAKPKPQRIRAASVTRGQRT